MNLKNPWQKAIKIYLAFLILFTLACTDNNTTNQNSIVFESANKEYPISHSLDSSLLLKYTTGIRSILEDSKGNIWFGSHMEGLCQFDGKQLTYFTVDDGLSGNQVRSIYEDVAGQVWFECNYGLSSYDGEKIITHKEKNYTKKEEWQIDENDLWFKSDAGTAYNEIEGQPGAYRYDGNELTYHVFPIVMKPGQENYFAVTTPFQKGKDGSIWMGTYGAAIGYDGSKFTIIDNDYLGLNQQTGYLHIRSLLADSKGNIWIGNNGIGVLKYDGTIAFNFSGQQGLISEGSGLSGGFRSPIGSLEHVFAIGEDTYGNIWFGDRDTGAWRYDGKTMKNFTNKNGLTSTHIWQIYTSKNGELWLAMEDGSVMAFNGQSFERIF